MSQDVERVVEAVDVGEGHPLLQLVLDLEQVVELHVEPLHLALVLEPERDELRRLLAVVDQPLDLLVQIALQLVLDVLLRLPT